MRLAIEGDLRFLSHHDVQRAMERIARRAKLPLKYSQGFNPRPILSLPCPLPVGIATRDDRVVFTLETERDGDDLCRALQSQAPDGMTFAPGRVLPPKVTPQARRMCYQLPLRPEERRPVADRCDALIRDNDAWTVRREGKRSRRTGQRRILTVDLRPMVEGPSVETETLRFACVPVEGRWARPGEVLDLVGLPGPENLARLVRTRIEDDLDASTEGRSRANAEERHSERSESRRDERREES